jgi:hypothetical protein
LFEHDLFGKPLHTFPHHALAWFADGGKCSYACRIVHFV